MERSMLSCSMIRVMPRVRTSVPPCCSPKARSGPVPASRTVVSVNKNSGSIGFLLPRGAIELLRAYYLILSLNNCCRANSRVSYFLQKQKLTNCLPTLTCEKKTRPGNRRHAGVGDQMTHEGSVAGHAESCDIGHHVICAMRRKAFETSTLQAGDEVVAARGVLRVEVAVVVVRQGESQHPGLLQGRGGAHRQKIVDSANRAGQVGRGKPPPHPPPGHGIRLTHTIDQDASIAHTGKRHDRDMHGAVVQDVLVDLVGNGQAIELLAKSGNVP